MFEVVTDMVVIVDGLMIEKISCLILQRFCLLRRLKDALVPLQKSSFLVGGSTRKKPLSTFVYSIVCIAMVQNNYSCETIQKAFCEANSNLAVTSDEAFLGNPDPWSV